MRSLFVLTFNILEAVLVVESLYLPEVTLKLQAVDSEDAPRCDDLSHDLDHVVEEVVVHQSVDHRHPGVVHRHRSLLRCHYHDDGDDDVVVFVVDGQTRHDGAVDHDRSDRS